MHHAAAAAAELRAGWAARLCWTLPAGEAAATAAAHAFTPRTFTYRVDGGASRGGTHVIIHGSDARARTVTARVDGFYPYLYVRLPDSVLAPGVSDVQRHALAGVFVARLERLLHVVLDHGARHYDKVRRAVSRDGYSACVTHGARPVQWFKVDRAIAVKGTGADRGFRPLDRRPYFVQIAFYCPALLRVAAQAIESGVTTAAELYTAITAERGAAAPATAGKKRSAAAGLRAPARNSKAAKMAVAARAVAGEEPEVGRPEDDDDEMDEDQLDPWNDPRVAAEDLANDDAAAAAAAENDDNDVPTAGPASGRVPPAPEFDPLRFEDDGDAPPGVYDADLEFTLRYCVDAGFAAEEWVTYAPVHVVASSDAHVELHVRRDARTPPLCRCTCDALQDAVAPQLCLSFDIETWFDPSTHINAVRDKPVLCIAAYVFDSVNDAALRHAVPYSFVLESTAGTPGGAPNERADENGGRVWCYRSELAMLQAFSRFVAELAPDMITGWNIEGFDLPFLIERAALLSDGGGGGGSGGLVAMARAAGHYERASRLRVAQREFSSSAHGTHLFTEVTGTGLWVYDLFQAFKRSTKPAFKLRSYALGAVAGALLNDRKDDVAYSEINALFTDGGVAGRERLRHYCAKDALLPVRLIARYVMHLECIELSRASGVPIDPICRKGLQVRSKALLFREALLHTAGRHVFYHRSAADRERESGASYAGGYVMEPVHGLHDDIVVTLDYASLYPSLIVTHDVCPTTLVRAEVRGSVPAADVWTPDFDLGADGAAPCFVRAAAGYVGLVPTIEIKLLARRKEAKRKMALAKAARDAAPEGSAEYAAAALLMAVYDQQQLTKKLQANGLYGVLGASTFFMYAPECAALVTGAGRHAIEWTAAVVRARFTRANGYPCEIQLVAGDTDSVFVKLLGVKDLVLGVRLGQEMAAFASKALRTKYGDRPDNIMQLEYEKLFLAAWKRWVRREVAPLVARGVGEILRLLLTPAGGATRAERLAAVRTYVRREMLDPVMQGTVNLADVTHTAQLRKRVHEYTAAGTQPPAHVALAARLAERHGADSPLVPKPGDRVAYVMVQRPEAPRAPVSQCAEAPLHAWRHRMPLHRAHYIDGAILKTLARTLEPVLAPDMHTTSAGRHERDLIKHVEQFLAGGRDAGEPRVLAAGGEAAGKRCALCRVPCGAAELCDGHGDEERVRYAAARARERDAVAGERAALFRECRACVAGFRADADPARAAAYTLPDMEDLALAATAPPPAKRRRVGAALDALTPCKNESCRVFWQRLRNDRLSGASL